MSQELDAVPVKYSVHNKVVLFMAEVWRPVELFNMFNYECKWRYEVSDAGRVRRAGYWGYKRRRFYPERMMKLHSDSHGRLKVTLQCEGKAHTCHVHRLVAHAFLPNPHGFSQVIHKDGDIQNNHVSNLAWTNSTSQTPHIRRVSKAVRQYSKDGVLLAEYTSATVAQRITGFDHATISACCHRKKRRIAPYGFIWRFTTDDEFFIEQ